MKYAMVVLMLCGMAVGQMLTPAQKADKGGWQCGNKKDILLHSDDGEDHWCLSPETANSNPQGMQSCVESIKVNGEELNGKVELRAYGELRLSTSDWPEDGWKHVVLEYFVVPKFAEGQQ